MKRPIDWKGFLTNYENKKAVIHLLHQHWNSADMSPQIHKNQSSLLRMGKHT